MQYLLLIYGDESNQPPPEKMPEVMKAWFDYNDVLEERDALVGGDALEPTGTATTIRVRDGKTLTTDGPFAETKEQLGGYYLIDCKDLDEALELAARCPGALNGSIEVRPVMVLPDRAD
jgi:hypothetical protein